MELSERSAQYVRFLIERPFEFGHLLGFDKLGDLHNGWMRDMISGTGDMTLLAHRLSYKTTCVSIVLSILSITVPLLRSFFMRKTDSDTKEIVAQVQKILESDVAQHFAGQIWGVDLRLIEKSATKLTTNLVSDVKGASQLTCQGIGGSLTGKHFDRIFTDDIVNLVDRVSKAEREHTKLVYQELQNIRNRGGRIINTGTPWHKDDAIGIMPNVRRYDCNQTGLIDAATLQQLRDTMTPSLFAANYELIHIAAADALFGAPSFAGVEGDIYDGICHIDAAYGGADGTAFTALHKHPGGRYTGFGKLWHRHVDECIGEILGLKAQYRLGTTYCEDNADKGYLRKELRRRGDTVAGYHEAMNKYVKIAAYLKKEWANIDWLPDTDPEYINEILDYTENAEHDDAPDSAASLMRKLTYKDANPGAESSYRSPFGG